MLFLLAPCAEEVPALAQFIKVIINNIIAAPEMLFRALCDIDSVGFPCANSVFSGFTLGFAVFASCHLVWELFSVHMETHREIALSPLILVYNAKLP